MRWVTATRRLVTGVPVLVKRSSGVSTRLPAMVVWLSAAMLCVLLRTGVAGGGLAFGAEPFRTVPLADGLEAGAAGGDGDAGAEDQGGFAVAHGLAAVGVVGVGGDAVVGIQPVEGLLLVAVG